MSADVPVLALSMLAANPHIHAVGAIASERMEFEPAIPDLCMPHLKKAQPNLRAASKVPTA